LIKRFRELGFDGPMSGGRHSFMIRGSLKVRVPNAHEGDIAQALLKEILRQAGISEENWISM
jgi:predicted RNA binding protein YcfA (HicA-like mRNA interferase family)